MLYSILGAITTVMGAIVLIKLLKDNDASSIIPQIQPVVILLTILLGYALFNESMTKNKIIGGLCIICGLYIINKK